MKTRYNAGQMRVQSWEHEICVASHSLSEMSWNLIDVHCENRVKNVFCAFASQLKFKENVECQKVCAVKVYDPKKNEEDKKKLGFLTKAMQLNYQNHWLVVFLCYYYWSFLLHSQYQ